jgi:hypothetical protein
MGTLYGPVLAFTLITLLGAAVVGFFFFRTQYRTLMAITPINRLMAPGLVWLQYIPVFAIIWQFVVIIQIARSLRNERIFRMEESLLSNRTTPQLPSGNYPTMALGLSYCILALGFTFFNLFGTFSPNPDVTSSLVVLAIVAAAGICWIVYWIRLANIRAELSRTAAVS